MPHFREKKSGVVVFFGSMTGWKGDAVAGAYCSSKAALESALYQLPCTMEFMVIQIADGQ